MYTAKITRDRKAAFILLIDRSGSMSEEVLFRGKVTTKAFAVATIANMFLDELVNRCRREDGVRDYFDIAAIEYSGDGVKSLLSDDGKFTSTTTLSRMPVKTEHYSIERRLPGGNTMITDVRCKQWICPKAEGNTPTITAMREAKRLSAAWCRNKCNADNFPPVVLNITDGETSDGDSQMMFDAAWDLQQLRTNDGNLLLFNIHICSSDNSDAQLKFPSEHETLPMNRYARLLYSISSTLPECYNDFIIETKGPTARPPFKAMCYNCSLEELLNVLSIGSSSMEKMI